MEGTIGDSARCMQNLEKVLFTGLKTSDTVTFIFIPSYTRSSSRCTTNEGGREGLVGMAATELRSFRPSSFPFAESRRRSSSLKRNR